VATLLGVSNETVRAWGKRYQAEGLKSLSDKPRSGRPIQIDGLQRAQITALACSEAPTGHSDWTHACWPRKWWKPATVCEHISYTQVGTILKKKVKPHLKKSGCLGQLTPAFLARMEQLLWLYALSYDPNYPVICFDDLNTHTPAAFYEFLPAYEVFALAQRFEFYYTPRRPVG
jgi:transposase